MCSELKNPVPAISYIPIATAGKIPSSLRRTLILNYLYSPGIQSLDMVCLEYLYKKMKLLANHMGSMLM